ncbi:MAG: hypothetical protein LBT43_16290 [Prevotella sp.]|jgi:hypothetical protein|nr:hypothetical protein [Prevotella sp.]
MKNKIFLFSTLLFLFAYTALQGQDKHFTGQEMAETAFKKEEYKQVINICNIDKRHYPSKNPIRENLFDAANSCNNLLCKDCDIIALNKVKEIRFTSWYHLTNHPKTDKKIDDCKNNRQTSSINDKPKELPKEQFEVGQIIDVNSYPLNDSTQLEFIYTFLNRFASAFWDKDLAFIEMMFNDYALIIHEKTEIKYKKDENGNRIKSPYTQKTEKDKEKYIEELEKAFLDNEWIDVHFLNMKICRSKRDTNVYGINAFQVWDSPVNYDESGGGWVFFKIDFTNPKEPSIWIKTWQSYNTPEENIYWLGNIPSVRPKR